MNAIAVDDEFYALERIKKLIIETEGLNLVASFSEVDKFLIKIKEDLKVDVVFLDIEMPNINGLELAEEIMQIDDSIDIVFVTAYENYAVKAFKINALDYLLKPVNKKRFKETINRLDVTKDTEIKKDKRLKVNAFGKINFIYQGEELKLDWPTDKCCEVFLYLLHKQGDFVESNKLAGVLWPNRASEKASNVLYTNIYSLRKFFRQLGFENIIASKRGYYKLNLDLIDLDVIRFQKIVNNIKAEIDSYINQVNKLIEIYQGDFLVQKDYYWLYGVRVELAKEYKNTLFQAAKYYLENEKYQLAKKILEEILEIDFLFEPAQKALIKFYKKQGEYKLAQLQYQKYKMELEKELGFELKNNLVDD